MSSSEVLMGSSPRIYQTSYHRTYCNRNPIPRYGPKSYNHTPPPRAAKKAKVSKVPKVPKVA